MSAEDNKAIFRLFMEDIWNQGKFHLLNDYIHEDHVLNGPGVLPGQPGGAEGIKMRVAHARNGFPDLNMKIDDQVAEGDKVMTQWTATGTNLGDMRDSPATGKQATWSGVTVSRFDNGKIVESWHMTDRMGLMQQLGVVRL